MKYGKREVEKLEGENELIEEIKTPSGTIFYRANSLQDLLIMEQLNDCFEKLNPVHLLRHLKLIAENPFLL